MFGENKESRELYQVYLQQVLKEEDSKVKDLKNKIKDKNNTEKGFGLDGSINVPGLGKTIKTRNNNNNTNNKTDTKTDTKTDNRARITVGGKTYYKGDAGYDAAMKKAGPDEATSPKGVIQKDKDKKALEDGKVERAENEWGKKDDGTNKKQAKASDQISAYQKGRPSPATFKTNQRQTRDLVKSQSKQVYPSITNKDLNQFSRSKKYTADDGKTQVQRSTVFTKHYKTGKPLGVMTGSQRKSYDLEYARHLSGANNTSSKIDGNASGNYVKTTPKTHYTSKIGGFLNNKKKGDLKDKSRHVRHTQVMDLESYDPFDIVLGYLQESGQVDSIDEALYIMMEMDAATIQSIVKDFENLAEEAADKEKDDRLVKYGIGHDGSDKKGGSGRRSGKKPKGKTNLQKEDEKKYGKGKSAVDIVRAKIEKEHGKGAIA